MNRVTTALYFLVSLVNLAPLPGAAGQKYLETLYGVSISSPDLLFLMQHRALLFGIVGGLLLYAALRPRHRPLASIVALYSMGSFILLYLFSGLQSEPLVKACVIDAIAILVLSSAVFLDRGRLGLKNAPDSDRKK